MRSSGRCYIGEIDLIPRFRERKAHIGKREVLPEQSIRGAYCSEVFDNI